MEQNSVSSEPSRTLIFTYCHYQYAYLQEADCLLMTVPELLLWAWGQVARYHHKGARNETNGPGGHSLRKSMQSRVHKPRHVYKDYSEGQKEFWQNSEGENSLISYG